MNLRHAIVVLILGNWRLASTRGRKIIRAGIRTAGGRARLLKLRESQVVGCHAFADSPGHHRLNKITAKACGPSKDGMLSRWRYGVLVFRRYRESMAPSAHFPRMGAKKVFTLRVYTGEGGM